MKHEKKIDEFFKEVNAISKKNYKLIENSDEKYKQK